MNAKQVFSLVLLIISTLQFASPSAFAQGTAFTYQGQLSSNGVALNGNYDFQFSLFNASSGGSQVGSTITQTAIGVTNGLFTTTMDFGPGIFTGPSYWLAIGVRSNGSGAGFTALNPLQPLTPTPYAIYTPNAGNATTAGTASSVAAGNIAGPIALAQLGAGTANISISGNATMATSFTGSLVGDVTGTQAATVVAKVGGQLAANVAGGADAANSLLRSNESFCFFAGPGVSNYSALTGSLNTAVGYLALSNTGGSGNTAIGYNALGSSNVGSLNTAIGYNALWKNSGGWLNTAIGDTALELNTIGYYNTAVGYEALVGNTTGSNNIAVGYQAGQSVSTGTNNIYIGNIGNGNDNNIIRIGSTQSTNYLAGVITGNGGGLTNLPVSTLTSGVAIGSGTNNTVVSGNLNSFIGGGSNNSIQTGNNYAIIGGGDGNTIQTGDNESIIGGGTSNTIVNTSPDAAIAGGFSNIIQANAGYSFIGGGQNNQATNAYATVSGGYHNSAGGVYASTVGGGFENTASGYAATVSGGDNNNAIGTQATVGGGSLNNATNSYATVPGGYANLAGGQFSFAAGQQAQATNQGAFVWADSQNAAFSSTTNDQFSVRAQGGAVFATGAAGMTVSGPVAANSFSGNGAVPWQVPTSPTIQAVANTGYLLTGTQSVNVTLPASPNLGDVVRVSSVGTGGWTVAQNSGQSILAANFTVLASPALNWTLTTAPMEDWSSIAASASGSQLVAAAYGDSIYISRDSGVSWTATTAGTGNWSSVASSADGTTLAATADGSDAIYLSFDSGASWSSIVATGPGVGWGQVALSADGKQLTAVVGRDENATAVIYMPNTMGTTIIQEGGSGGPGGGNCVTSAADGAEWVFGGLDYVTYGANSEEGWTSVDVDPAIDDIAWSCIASSADGSKLAVAGLVFSGSKNAGWIYTSSDGGATWMQSTNGLSSPESGWTSVASSSDGTKLVAASNFGIYPPTEYVGLGAIYTSQNGGATWTSNSAPSASWSAVASSADGSLLAAGIGGNGGGTTGGIYTYQAGSQVTTTTGTTGHLQGGQSTAVELQYVGNGQFMPLSHEGTIFAY